MKKIITALANSKINEILKQNEQIEVVAKDIIYQEGIFEVLEKEKTIDLIVLSDTLEGNISLPELIKKIQESHKIKQILILLKNKNQEIKVEDYKKADISIFYEEEITIPRILEIAMRKQKEKETIKEELEIEMKQNKKENKRLKKNKIITISGINQKQKNYFIIEFIKILSQKKQKMLMIDFDVLQDNSEDSLFEEINTNKKIAEEQVEYNQIIKKQKISEQIDKIKVRDILYQQETKVDQETFSNFIQKLKQEYEIILVNATIEYLYNYTKLVMNQSSNIIFLTSIDKKEIRKTRKMLEIYTKIWGIEQEKINIVFTIKNELPIQKEMLNQIFKSYAILGKVSIEKQIELENKVGIIPLLLKKQIKEEYWNIAREVLKR